MNEARLRLLLMRTFSDVAAAQSASLVALGDALGFYRALAQRAMTASELAEATQCDARLVSEWLRNQLAADYVSLHDDHYSLSDEQRLVFASDDAPVVMTGAFALASALASRRDALAATFRGEPLPLDGAVQDAIARQSRAKYAAAIDAWLPSGARERLEAGARVAEIGAGSGELLCAVARSRSLRGLGLELVLVDRQPCVGASTWDALSALGMRTHVVGADAVAWLAHPELSRCDAIVANLFLHHFETPALGRLLEFAAQRAPLFVACEPRRSALSLTGASLLGVIGCNDVTRHDAVVSVRAGFRDGELSALWPSAPEWRIEEGARGPFTHRFVARRA